MFGCTGPAGPSGAPAGLITGDVRPGNEFKFVRPPHHAAASTFTALADGRLQVTRHAETLFQLPDATPVLAHWHGDHRTDGFATTVGELKVKAKAFRK
jgi:hypothetical protein